MNYLRGLLAAMLDGAIIVPFIGALAGAPVVRAVFMSPASWVPAVGFFIIGLCFIFMPEAGMSDDMAPLAAMVVCAPASVAAAERPQARARRKAVERIVVME